MVVALALTMAGCMTGGAMMQHPGTGQTHECGRYVLGSPLLSMSMERRERDCIEDFRKQGFERQP